LAPFGKGNPAPVLVASGVRIEEKRVIGRREDHLTLNLIDKQQKTHRVLWWNGVGLPLPNGEFDLAYSARRSNYRGQPQIQIEWVEWQQAETPETVEIRPEPSMVVIDHRREINPETHLSSILKTEKDVVVWREGKWIDQVAGVDRFGLGPGTAMVVWSLPASHELLDTAVGTIMPTRLFLFAQNPGYTSPEEFSKELAGLIKFSLNQREGKISVGQLAARMSHTRSTVEAGLRWLESRGDITIVSHEQDAWRIQAGSQPSGEAEELARILDACLEETRAFRRHYVRVEHGYLLLT
jgi:hypothetical protein